jgi:hypothetical protein
MYTCIIHVYMYYTGIHINMDSLGECAVRACRLKRGQHLGAQQEIHEGNDEKL